MLEGRFPGGRLGKAGEQLLQSRGQATHDRVGEGDCALDAGAAHQLHGLVRGGVGGDRAHEAELVGAQPERGEHGRIELAYGPTAERLDRVVERAQALDRAVGELHRERVLPSLQLGRGCAKGAVSVGALFGHAQDDVERHLPGGRSTPPGLTHGHACRRTRYARPWPHTPTQGGDPRSHPRLGP